MSPDKPHNRDLSARLADLIAANNIDAIMEQQPVRWRSATLRVHFEVDVANLGELGLDMPPGTLTPVMEG